MSERTSCDGKFFAIGGQRFTFRGVTYGTFAPRDDGERFPAADRVDADFAQIAAAGFTVVRTYTPPPPDVVDAAGRHGLRILAGVFYADWRYLLDGSRRQLRAVFASARHAVRDAARRYAGDPRILALSLGNEVPADVLRWLGAHRVADAIRRLTDVVRREDPDQLVTYANYPTAEYLPLDCLDFLTFNVFLERRSDLRRYLTRLHHLAGDRPLVLGELGVDAGDTAAGDEHQAVMLGHQLETAVERGVAGTCVFSFTDEWHVGDNPVTGWHFGLTRADRSPRPALEVARRWNHTTVRDLDVRWPSISVVVCAYNAADTLDECLRHTCALDYPDLEVVVVDDGSTDDTAAIAARHPRARLVAVPHAGLSVARNAGLEAASGDLVAYLDADAYPSPEWPYFLALGLDARDVGGVGGPNVPPVGDPPAAQLVARGPGGPVHVLLSDDRAEHIPGCNMAFWREVLNEVGGCDPIYTSAGDDVDLCWRVRDREWEIGFHPAALVWHHRRGSVRAYLRQQRGYGRAEALVEARHPDRFTAAGTARWHGRIYSSFPLPIRRQRVYRGIYGTAAYQSVYQGGGSLLDLLHQLGVPLAAAIVPTAPLGLLNPWLALPAAVAVATLMTLFAVDAARADLPRRVPGRRAAFRAKVACLQLLQPLVRAWGHVRHRAAARKDLPPVGELPAIVRRTRRGGVVAVADRPRDDVAAAAVAALRRRGIRTITSSGWDDYDARLLLSRTIVADLLTSCHPVGFVQAHLRRRPRRRVLAAAAIAAAVLAAINPPLALLVAVPTAASVGSGLWRARRLLYAIFPAGATPRPAAPASGRFVALPATRTTATTTRPHLAPTARGAARRDRVAVPAEPHGTEPDAVRR